MTQLASAWREVTDVLVRDGEVIRTLECQHVQRKALADLSEPARRDPLRMVGAKVPCVECGTETRPAA